MLTKNNKYSKDNNNKSNVNTRCPSDACDLLTYDLM